MKLTISTDSPQRLISCAALAGEFMRNYPDGKPRHNYPKDDQPQGYFIRVWGDASHVRVYVQMEEPA
jgi:hypothetical protein